MKNLEPIAPGVWLLRGGTPKTMNVFLIEDEGGVTVFDAGVRSMAGVITEAAHRFGGIKQVVLGHAHPDHRGAAPFLEAPVLCHPDEKRHVESASGQDYFDLAKLRFPVAPVMARLLRVWDGGLHPGDGRGEGGDVVAGFEVIHLPGHAPGLIALWRAEDGLARERPLLHTRSADRPEEAAAGPAPGVQLERGADESLVREDGRPGAIGGVAGPLRAGSRRRRGGPSRAGGQLAEPPRRAPRQESS